MKTLNLKYPHIVGGTTYGPGEVTVEDDFAPVLENVEKIAATNPNHPAGRIEQDLKQKAANDGK